MIIPEFKIELMNKSKKILNTVEFIKIFLKQVKNLKSKSSEKKRGKKKEKKK